MINLQKMVKVFDIFVMENIHILLVNIMAADVLVMQGTMTGKAVPLNYYASNIMDQTQ